MGQGEDGLVVTFPLLAFALVVGPGDGAGAQGGERTGTLSSPGFCGGWFIWCGWFPVVIVPGCSG